MWGSLPIPLRLPEFAQHPFISAGIWDWPQGQDGVNRGAVETFGPASLVLLLQGQPLVITARELPASHSPSHPMASLHLAQKIQNNLNLSYFPQTIDSQQKCIRVGIEYDTHAHQ